LLLDGRETEDAALELRESYQYAVDDPDASVIFWLAFAAAQMETGRLQADVRDKALSIVDAGGDVARWAEEDATLARQREQVLHRLAAKLRGPQPKPKRLRRAKPLGVAFERGDVVRLRGPKSGREALAVVVAHNDGYPRGTLDPVVELLAWEGGALPTPREIASMPTVMCLNELQPGREPYHRPHLWIIFTALKRHVFSDEFGEVVARGIQRAPCGDHTRTDVFSEVGASSLSWSALCTYLDQEYADDLRVTLDASRKRGPSRFFRRR
jgi:hypothetical protein